MFGIFNSLFKPFREKAREKEKLRDTEKERVEKHIEGLAFRFLLFWGFLKKIALPDRFPI